jgi:UDP-GlcNAc:undecaprenyl-phosphate GlcNAc-1-phosphate transferase
MDPLFAAGTALAISLATIPLMIKLAPRLRLLDRPNERKIHAQPIPRIGGWGISVGALVAILLWTPMGPVAMGFVVAGLILVFAGAADDMFDLPGSTKLVLQIISVLPAVLYAGLVVDVVPLVQEIRLPFAAAVPLTIIGLVTCINATNTSDGLDGLAAGATLLSLFGILSLAFKIEAMQFMIMTGAALGGLIGFLRYNTHPAVIFMGDLGSQFLGLSVGFLALGLLHSSPETMSPWAVLLLVGLPALDLMVVALRRLLGGKSLFRADNSHIHHRFLDLGLSHTQSVATFYTLQGSFVFFGVALSDSSALVILSVYFLHFAMIYGFLKLAEHSLVSKHAFKPRNHHGEDNNSLPRHALLWVPRVVLEATIPLLLVVCAAGAGEVTQDFGVLGAGLLLIMLVGYLNKKMRSLSAMRFAVFLTATAALNVYTGNRPFLSGLSLIVEISLMVILAGMVLVAIKYSPKRRKEEFRSTRDSSTTISPTALVGRSPPESSITSTHDPAATPTEPCLRFAGGNGVNAMSATPVAA